MPIAPKHTDDKTQRTSIWQMDVADLLSFGKRKRLPVRDIAVFCRKAAFLFGAGLPVNDVMSMFSAQLPGKRLNPIVENVHKNVLKGVSFSASVKEAGVFPPFMCHYIEIGEKTAQLPKVCEQLADFYEAQASTRSELIAALMYPLAVSVLMLGVIVLALIFVIPGYADIFASSGMPLPGLTTALIGISSFFAANWFLLLLGIAFAALAVMFFLNTAAGASFFAYFKLKIPIVKLNFNLRFTQSVSLLLSSGLSVSQAVSLCGDVIDNPHIKSELTKLNDSLTSGDTFWQGLEKIIFVDRLLIGLTRVGEETGSLTQTMEKCRSHYEAVYKHEIRRLNKLIEPVVTLVLGLILAAVMLAVVFPTFQLATVM